MSPSKTKKLQALQAQIKSIEASKPTLSFAATKKSTDEKLQRTAKLKNKKRLLKDALKDIAEQQEESPEQIARKYALDCLIRREHGFVELQRKMNTKGFDEGVCEFVLHQLKGDGSQSDERFAKAMVAHGAFKEHGPAKIRRGLQQKGLSGKWVDIAFEASEVDWYELALSVRIKKYGEGLPKEWKDKAKQMRFLQQRGFDMGQINQSFK